MTDLDVADEDSAAMRRDRVFRRLIVQEVLLYDSDFLPRSHDCPHVAAADRRSHS